MELFVVCFVDEQGILWLKFFVDFSMVFICYSWFGNVCQLKNVVYCVLIQLEGFELCLQDILLLDYDVVLLLVGEEVMEGLLDDIICCFECLVLIQFYCSYFSICKLVKWLGVLYIVIVNKLCEYGLSQKKGDE